MPLPTHIDLQIVTPDRLLVREQVDEVEIPGTEGYFGVLPGHTPMLASLSVGELWYRKGQEKTYLAIAYGFAEVLPDRVTILAQLAELACGRGQKARRGPPHAAQGGNRLRTGPRRPDQVAGAPAGCLAHAVVGSRRPPADAAAAELTRVDAVPHEECRTGCAGGSYFDVLFSAFRIWRPALT